MRCDSDTLYSHKHLRKYPYFIFCTRHFFLFNPTSLSACFGPWYWSHHLRNLLEPYILSEPVKISYIDLPDTYSVIVACRLLMYSFIGQIPVTSNAASTEAHSHLSPSPFLGVIPAIRLAIMWWNSSNAVIIVSVAPHISLPYRSTACTTALYIIAWYLIGNPVLPITFF